MYTGRQKEIIEASLYTADNIVGTDDGMDVKAFYKKVLQSDDELAKIRSKVISNEMIFGRLVSDDETVTVIIAEIKDDVFSQKFYNRILSTTALSETEV